MKRTTVSARFARIGKNNCSRKDNFFNTTTSFTDFLFLSTPHPVTRLFLISGGVKEFSRTRIFLRFAKLAESLCQTHANIHVGFYGPQRSWREVVATNYSRFCWPQGKGAEPILKRRKRPFR